MFVKNMQAKRTKQGISQELLAEKVRLLGLSHFNQVALSRIEAGTRQLGLSEARTIARVLETSVDELLTPTAVYTAYQQVRLNYLQLTGFYRTISDELQELHELREDALIALQRMEHLDWRESLSADVMTQAEKSYEWLRWFIEVGVEGVVDKLRENVTELTAAWERSERTTYESRDHGQH